MFNKNAQKHDIIAKKLIMPNFIYKFHFFTTLVILNIKNQRKFATGYAGIRKNNYDFLYMVPNWFFLLDISEERKNYFATSRRQDRVRYD